MEEFICEAQDRTRNARSKSEVAAFNMWKEQLLCDQAKFEAERLMTLGPVQPTKMALLPAATLLKGENY